MSMPVCAGRPLCPNSLPSHGGNRDSNNDQNDHGKIVLDSRDVAKEKAGQSKQENPSNAPNYIVGNEMAIVHLPHSGDKGSKGANNGQKTSNDNCLCSVLFIKLSRLF